MPRIKTTRPSKESALKKAILKIEKIKVEPDPKKAYQSGWMYKICFPRATMTHSQIATTLNQVSTQNLVLQTQPQGPKHEEEE